MTRKLSSALRFGATLCTLVVFAAMLGSPAAATDPGSGPSGSDFDTLAVPGAPAPIRVLPICEQLQDPPTGACPMESDYLTVSSSGSMDGSAAVVFTISPTIPPCAARDVPNKTYIPSTCYTQIVVPGANSTFGAPRCEYLEDSTGLLKPCLVPYQDSFMQWEDAISLSGTWRYAHGLEIFGCASVSNFSQYYEGGPSNSGHTWPELAAETGDCSLTMDRTPDNLMGASWVILSGVLEVMTPGPDGPVRVVAQAEAYVGVNGTLGPFAEVTDPDPDPDPDPNPFNDVPTDAFYADAVKWLKTEGITTGTSATTYSPNDSVTRGQMAAFLHRLAGTPGRSAAQGFSDVSSGAFYAAAVEWLKDEGITTGTSATTYSPNDSVTRGQMAAFLHRLAGSPTGSPSHGFSDVPAGAFYADAVAWLKAQRITTGTSPATYSPNDVVTRGQMAAFLFRMATDSDWDYPGD